MATNDEVTDNEVTAALRVLAMDLPGVSETGVCVKRAFKAGKKSFAFMGIDARGYDLRLKLGDSYAEAERLAKKHPDRYVPGMHGWTHAKFAPDDVPPKGLLERWIEESYRLLAPKKLVAQLDAG